MRTFNYLYILSLSLFLRSNRSSCYAKPINDTCRYTTIENRVNSIRDRCQSYSFNRSTTYIVNRRRLLGEVDPYSEIRDESEDDIKRPISVEEPGHVVTREKREGPLSSYKYIADNDKTIPKDTVDNVGEKEALNNGDYVAEVEDEAEYRRNGLSPMVDEKFVDQDEKGFYDDFEIKDVVKRGATDGEGDYEEVEDDKSFFANGDSSEEKSVSISEEEENEEAKGDGRVKREENVRSSVEDTDRSEGRNEENPSARAIKDDTTKTNESKVGGNVELDESQAEYEKRVEEQIQRKIDSIKEEIKREIEEKQRIREIETNNAKFDELQHREDEEEEPSERLEERAMVGDVRSIDGRRSVKREKRSDRGTIEDRKSRFEGKNLPLKKREYARRLYLVKDGYPSGKKRRKRRSKSSIPEGARVKDKDNSSPVQLDSSRKKVKERRALDEGTKRGQFSVWSKCIY